VSLSKVMSDSVLATLTWIRMTWDATPVS
jgi:hypothetical protein